MTIKQRIAEARGLCRDIDSDLQQLEILNGARNPEASEGYAANIFYSLQNELREHVAALLDHYERQTKKRRKKEGR